MGKPEVFRAIRKVWKSEPTREGAGVHLRRAFGFHELPQLDPFLLLDHLRSENPDDYRKGLPWHPHRGEVQWMTAGGGIIHQEIPKGDRTGRMLGMLRWANRPRSRG